jgi:hypothetical protein
MSQRKQPPQSLGRFLERWSYRLALLLAAACSSRSSPGAPAEAGPQGSPACKSCQDQKCCITASSATAKPGEWTQSASLVCRQNACAAECGTSPAKYGNITPSPASCTAAAQAACCPALTACGESDECLAILYLCIDRDGCDPSAPCFADCRVKYPKGAVVFDKLNACFSNVACP